MKWLSLGERLGTAAAATCISFSFSAASLCTASVGARQGLTVALCVSVLGLSPTSASL